MSYRIELKDVSFSYETGGEVLKRVNLSVDPGEVLAVVSAVGGGKTTLLKVAAGLLEPLNGRLVIDHKFFWGLSDIERNEIRRDMGFVFQEAALIVNMTIAQNLELPLRYHGAGSRGQAQTGRVVSEWLDKLGLERYRDSLPAALSAGLKKRASFARAMLSRGKFFFFDEPTEGSGERFEELTVETILRGKKEGIGAIVATQSASLLSAVADKILVLEGGEISYCGPVDESGIVQRIKEEGMVRS